MAVMICKFGHKHPPRDVVAATSHPTEPHGLRPYHCPNCREIKKKTTVKSNWLPDPN